MANRLKGENELFQIVLKVLQKLASLFDDENCVIKLLTLEKRMHVAEKNGKVSRAFSKGHDDCYFAP